MKKTKIEVEAILEHPVDLVQDNGDVTTSFSSAYLADLAHAAFKNLNIYTERLEAPAADSTTTSHQVILKGFANHPETNASVVLKHYKKLEAELNKNQDHHQTLQALHASGLTLRKQKDGSYQSPADSIGVSEFNEREEELGGKKGWLGGNAEHNVLNRSVTIENLDEVTLSQNSLIALGRQQEQLTNQLHRTEEGRALVAEEEAVKKALKEEEEEAQAQGSIVPQAETKFVSAKKAAKDNAPTLSAEATEATITAEPAPTQTDQSAEPAMDQTTPSSQTDSADVTLSTDNKTNQGTATAQQSSGPSPDTDTPQATEATAETETTPSTPSSDDEGPEQASGGIGQFFKDLAVNPVAIGATAFAGLAMIFGGGGGLLGYLLPALGGVVAGMFLPKVISDTSGIPLPNKLQAGKNTVKALDAIGAEPGKDKERGDLEFDVRSFDTNQDDRVTIQEMQAKLSGLDQEKAVQLIKEIADAAERDDIGLGKDNKSLKLEKDGKQTIIYMQEVPEGQEFVPAPATATQSTEGNSTHK